MVSIYALFVICYIAISLYYLRFSASPSEACNKSSTTRTGQQQLCAQPLFPPSDIYTKAGKSKESNAIDKNISNTAYSLELWTLHEHDPEPEHEPARGNGVIRRPKPEWKLLSTCPPMNVDLQESLYHKFKFGGKSSNCTLDFPTFARIRQDKDHPPDIDIHNSPPTIMKGKFVLKQRMPPSPDIIIAHTTFDLTRIVQRQKNSKIPYFKYHKQPIVLRIVADHQLYPIQQPFRGDGLQLTLYQSKFNGIIYHRPTFYVDDVALKHSSQIQLAPPEEQEKNPRPPINMSIQLSIISPLRHVGHRQLDTGFGVVEGILNPDEIDEIRHMISDEYMYRFILTQIISFVHIYLDYVAFRDEVGFYVGKKSMAGISFSSVLGRFICQLIIFLYLCDGGNTSWLILGSIGSGVAVEFWKVTKFIKPKLVPRFPFVQFQRGRNLTQLEQDTVNYDSIAHTYLGMILYPFVFGSAIYARKYYVYASWWSWLISNLANAVYTFGFITLCPQLYVNYRLKSVAHLPWKVFVYKIFNTFVDDIFAFMIQMPLKHKLMTLRDDVVFVGFLIQAYVYRVDKSRTNEFGFAYDDEEEETKGAIEECRQDDKVDEKVLDAHEKKE
jgi:hypothetical protein